MKSLSVIVIFFFFMGQLLAQEKVQLFGYFETQFTGAKLNDEFIQLNANKLRLDFESQPTDNVKFGANYNLLTYHGKTQWYILDYLPDNVTDIIPQTLQEFYVLPFEDRSYLDNAYVRLSIRFFDLTAGKQQISLGTGYAWNPTDLFNTKDLLDPTYEQPGHNAIRLDMPLGMTSTMTILWGPQESWIRSVKLIQFKTQLNRFDLTIMGMEKQHIVHDYTQFQMDLMNPGFLELFENRKMFGFSTAGELFGLGVWGELAYHKLDISESFTDWLVGFDYTFDSGTYVMTEYYQSGQAKHDSDDYDLNDWMRYLASEQKAIARDQVYALVQHPITDLIQLGTSVIAAVSDGSFGILPTLNATPYENVEILAYLNFYFGNTGSAYNKQLGNGGFIRAKVYF